MKRTSLFSIMALTLLYMLGKVGGNTISAAAQATAAASSSGHIAYVVQFDDACDLHLADMDGKNDSCIGKELMTDTINSGKKAAKVPDGQKVRTTIRSTVQFSPDGSKVMFIITVQLYNDTIDALISRLYTIGVAGGAPTMIAEDTVTGLDVTAAASPDGTLLAYTKPSGRSHQNLIFVSGYDGSSPRQVSATAGAYGEIAWSPDGKQLLITTNTMQVILLDPAATKGKSQVLNLPATYYEHGSWSPDGKEILIDSVKVGSTATVWTLYRYTLATKKAVSVTSDKTQIEFALWSPDGHKLLGTVRDPANHGQPNLYSINPDGTGLQKLLDNVYKFEYTSDKAHIVYIGDSNGMIANLDGSGAQVLAKNVSAIAVGA